MLPLNANSTAIQKRRQTHRRQQSLEVPILATPLPPNSRRRHPANRPGHRRGLSLDQSLGVAQSPSGFRPLLPQDVFNEIHNSGPTFARSHSDTNHTVYPLDQQHFKQETQEHSQAQPGQIYQPAPQHAQSGNFQSHLQSQVNGVFSANSPNPDQAAAMQSLQEHLTWYQQKYGNGQSSNPQLQTPPVGQINHPLQVDMAAPVYLSQIPIPAAATTPMTHGHSQTVPNTPQNYVQGWPSPKPTHGKHQRSQSYQLDVAPMSQNHDGVTFSTHGQVFDNGSFSFQQDQDYAASNYSSSIADASSPPHQHSTPMPTLFEEPLPNYSGNGSEPTDSFMQGSTVGEPDFNDPHFMIGGGAMCAEQAALDAAGIDATYIETGITEEQINSWLTQPVRKGDAYCCKWEGCNTKINRKENARSHIQNHLDDRRFRCNPCGKRFNRLHDTKRHHLTHTNERPAVCPCGKTFARADALTRHRQRDMCEGVLPGFEKAEEEKPKRGRPKKDRSDDSSRIKKSSRPDLDTRVKKAALARAIDRADATQHHGGGGGSVSSGASDRSMPDTPPQDLDDLDTSDFLNMGGAVAQFSNATSTWLDTPPTSPPSTTPVKSSSSKIFIDLSLPVDLPESVSPSKLSTRSSPPANGAGSPTHESLSTGCETNRVFTDYSSPAVINGTSGFTGDSSPLDPGMDIFSDAVDFDIMDAHPKVGGDVFSPPGESCSGSSVYNSDWDTVVPVGSLKSTIHTAPSAVYGDSFGDGSREVMYGMEEFMDGTEEEQYNQVRDILDSWVSSH